MLERKQSMGENSYLAALYRRGEDVILKKIAEESGEVIIASKGGEKEKLIHELTDLWFHSMALMAFKGITPGDIAAKFIGRKGRSGLEEKASRKDETF